jgi:hypothetical protein
MFGGAAGGPILKNKTFFFPAYQGDINRTPANALSRVPTSANLQGDLSDWPRQIYDPFTTRPDPSNPRAFIRDPFAGNQIPATRIFPGAVAYAKATLPASMATGVSDRNLLDLTPSKTNQSDGGSFRFTQMIPSVTGPVSVAFENNHLYILAASKVESHQMFFFGVNANPDGIASLIKGDGTRSAAATKSPSARMSAGSSTTDRPAARYRSLANRNASGQPLA